MNQTRGPIRMLFDLFSSVKFGILLLVLLFIYSSIGSAGILYPIAWNVFDLDNWAQIRLREMRGFEMTEFEWFHWWPFDVMIALICLTMIVTTLRRIPFRPINFGVWMIHTGIIILCIGSVWYFSAKVEGDSPIFRRQVRIVQSDGQSTALTARVGATAVVGGGASATRYEVVSVDPSWELLTGSDAGEQTYAVSLSVRGPGKNFVRQLLDGYPQYTEDVIPGQGRAVKVTGEKLVDPELDMSLDYQPQEYFYLVHSEAIYLRRVGDDAWIERPLPIRKVPKYNDSVAEDGDVWSFGRNVRVALDDLGIRVPTIDRSDDVDATLAEFPLTIDSYLRYAILDERHMPGGERFDPLLHGQLLPAGGQPVDLTLLANDPQHRSFANGFVQFHWLDDESRLEALQGAAQGVLTFTVHGNNDNDMQTVEFPIADIKSIGDDAAFQPIGNSSWSFRVRRIDRIQPDDSGMILAVAFVDLQHEDGTSIRRWVFDQPQFNRDQIIDESGQLTSAELNSDIETTFQPDTPIMLVAGPGEDQLRMLAVNSELRKTNVMPIEVGQPINLSPALAVRIDSYSATSRIERKPLIVPIAQRTQERDMMDRMVRVALPAAPGKEPATFWLPFHQYPYQTATDVMPGDRFDPTRITLSDGSQIELLFSRRRLPLPQPIVLTDFEVDYHLGGFSGSNQSVQQWRSIVQFLNDDGSLSERKTVSVNNPAEEDGYWFFQAQWDPPRSATDNAPASKGLNHTVLGVGNRDGVYVQLIGCCIAVLGMLYAFYIKPMIKRRQREAVYQSTRQPAADTTTSENHEAHEILVAEEVR